MQLYINTLKAIPICGISILGNEKNSCLEFKFKKNTDDESYYFDSVILTKESFENVCSNERLRFYNEFDSDNYDSVIMYRSLGNNSEELNYIKYILTSLYFANRWANEDIEFESSEIFINTPDEFYRDKSGDITPLRIPIKIGPNPANKNHYNESINRLYGIDLGLEYDGHNRYLELFPYRNQKLDIEISDNLKYRINQISGKLNDGSDYSKRMLSAFRLYFDTIPEYDIEKNIVNYATIFETLLLGNDEDNQRKKVSARSACLLCDKLGLEEKMYIAEIIYQFYYYRNKIVHDGYSYLDLGDSINIPKMLNCIKNIIYFITKKIIKKDIKKIKDIKDTVKNNMEIDGLENSFNYISSDTDINSIISRIVSGHHYEFQGPKTEDEINKYREQVIRAYTDTK